MICGTTGMMQIRAARFSNKRPRPFRHQNPLPFTLDLASRHERAKLVWSQHSIAGLTSSRNIQVNEKQDTLPQRSLALYRDAPVS